MRTVVVAALVLILLVGCSTTSGSSRQVPSPQERSSGSEMEELAESLERLREAVEDALDRLTRAHQAAVPLSLDRHALEEVERLLTQTLDELRGEVSTAGFRPLTPRQRLERLNAAVDGFVETLLMDIRRAEAGDVEAEAEEARAAEPAATTPARDPVPDHLLLVMADGERIFSSACAACHGGRGQGLTAPGLDGARRLSDSRSATSMILWGAPGHGMPAFHDELSDEGIAAVTTYVRNAWSNDFGPVTPEEVAETREGR